MGVPRKRESRAVLVVEDEPTLRRSLCEYVEEQGCIAVGAADGDDAIRVLSVTKLFPSLVLLDLRLPNVDGWTFRRWLKRQPRFRAVPVVVITGVSEPNAEDLEVEQVITKPFNVDDLAVHLQRHCA